MLSGELESEMQRLVLGLSLALALSTACAGPPLPQQQLESGSVYAESHLLAVRLLLAHRGESQQQGPDEKQKTEASSAETWRLVARAEGNLRLPLLPDFVPSPVDFVSDQCAEELRSLALGLKRRELWAIEFVDSAGKLPAGLLRGAVTWLGSYDQCLGASSGPPLNVTGSYCLLQLRHPPALNATPLTLGSCWPAGCSMSEVLNATSTAAALLGFQASQGNPECRQARQRWLEPGPSVGAVAVLALLSFIAFCLVAGTALDVWQRSRAPRPPSPSFPEPTADVASDVVSSGGGSSGNDEGGDTGVLLAAAAIHRDNRPRSLRCCMGCLSSVLLCFSLVTNAPKILSTRCHEGSLPCVNGIRFLSMSWVILGHTYVLGLGGISNLGLVAPKWINDWTFQAVLNASVAVDTFFVLSGLLATYLFLRELDTRRGHVKRINWVRFYLHRYWRLTAPYMIILGVWATLTQYLFDGPRYPREGFDKNCDTGWWRNLLYINNLFDLNDQCMSWSWYLANDMQFYAFSPLFLIPMALKPIAGAAVLVAAVLASTAGVAVRSALTGRRPGDLLDAVASGDYTRPWFRVAPYLVGSLAGLIAHRLRGSGNGSGNIGRRREPARRLRPALVLLGWTGCVGLCVAVLYGLFDVERGRTELPLSLSTLYNCTFRVAWALCVAWVALACSTGNGGPVSDLLSAGIFSPLSRLSYCAYLIHPVLMGVVETARRDVVQWDAWTPIGNYLGYLLGTYLLSFGASLALESPLIRLERLATTGDQ